MKGSDAPGSLGVVVELNEWTWRRFKRDVDEVTPEEANWRPMAESNTVNLIVRHLLIDASWHVAGIEQRERPAADSVPLDFERNVKALEESMTRFIDALRAMSLADLQRRSALAYQASSLDQASLPAHFLGFHFACHLAAHGGQIRTLRNLYRTTRGEPARFFPDNPTFPT